MKSKCMISCILPLSLTYSFLLSSFNVKAVNLLRPSNFPFTSTAQGSNDENQVEHGEQRIAAIAGPSRKTSLELTSSTGGNAQVAPTADQWSRDDFGILHSPNPFPSPFSFLHPSPASSQAIHIVQESLPFNNPTNLQQESLGIASQKLKIRLLSPKPSPTLASSPDLKSNDESIPVPVESNIMASPQSFKVQRPKSQSSVITSTVQDLSSQASKQGLTFSVLEKNFSSDKQTTQGSYTGVRPIVIITDKIESLGYGPLLNMMKGINEPQSQERSRPIVNSAGPFHIPTPAELNAGQTRVPQPRVPPRLEIFPGVVLENGKPQVVNDRVALESLRRLIIQQNPTLPSANYNQNPIIPMLGDTAQPYLRGPQKSRQDQLQQMRQELNRQQQGIDEEYYHPRPSYNAYDACGGAPVGCVVCSVHQPMTCSSDIGQQRPCWDECPPGCDVSKCVRCSQICRI